MRTKRRRTGYRKQTVTSIRYFPTPASAVRLASKSSDWMPASGKGPQRADDLSEIRDYPYGQDNLPVRKNGAGDLDGYRVTLCEGCSRPLHWWNRRVWQDRTRQFHRACWQGKQFFRKFITLHCEPRGVPEPAPGGYEVNHYDVEGQGLIVDWEIGWVNLNHGTLHALSRQFGCGAMAPSYQFSDITIGLVQRV